MGEDRFFGAAWPRISYGLRGCKEKLMPAAVSLADAPSADSMSMTQPEFAHFVVSENENAARVWQVEIGRDALALVC